jgi:2-polyprenyl-3-methyl-5-hydroxy-6-metoxy-1,4-benzoquinol methylase
MRAWITFFGMSVSYLFPSAKSVSRRDPCDLCGQKDGALVGQIDYIGLADLDMIQCPECGLISVDPIPSVDIVSAGCDRLYRIQQSGARRDQIIRGFAKSYRRGALFARQHLKKKVGEKRQMRVLEVGAGDGYFAAGLQAEIPEAQITVVDIAEGLAKYYENHHPGFSAFSGEMSSEFVSELLKGSDKKFDLVVFRDLLEHVRQPRAFLEAVSACSADRGLIFFITPNGKEDFWMIHQRFSKLGTRTLLLLNHFHYFLPSTLTRLLQETGFGVKTAFKFGLKQHREGLGRVEFSEFEKQEMPAVPEETLPLKDLWGHSPQEVRSRLLSNLGPLSQFYSHFADRESGRVALDSPHGHEFFVLAQKGAST